jgi:hypothetical protein
MSYAQHGKIEYTDYNTLVGTTTDTTANRLNSVFGVGSGSYGYGQTPISQVAQHDRVTAAQWASLINTTAALGNHQGTPYSVLSAPSTGTKVTYLAALPTNITNVYNGRLNAVAQGTSTPNVATNGSTWRQYLQFTHTVNFASGNAARYFFNAGGQIALTFFHPTNGTGANPMFSALCTACGTVVISSVSTGTVTIGSTLPNIYNGVTKVGGSGAAATLVATAGYYGLTNVDTEIFRQYPTSGVFAGYAYSYLSVKARTNGAQGSNADNGSQITITTLIDEVPDNLVCLSGASVTATIKPPSTAYLTNTWGTITVTNNVTGV